MPVRRLDKTQWPTVRAVRLRALRESPEAFSSSYEEEVDRLDDRWVEEMSRFAWFVAEQEDEIVGIVAGMPFGSSPEVVSMWVDPGKRGTGVADDLLSAVVAWAQRQGAGGLCLAIADGNEVARHFYERAGFVPSGPGDALRRRPDVCTTEMRLTF